MGNAAYQRFIIYMWRGLVLVVSVFGVVDGVVQAAALLALERLAGDEVAHVNHVAQLANVAGSLYVLDRKSVV